MVPFHSNLAKAGTPKIAITRGLPAILGAVFLVASVLPSSGAQSDRIDAWLAAQTNLISWSAEFVQTRKLKTLAQPLKSNGRLWFQSPNRFRWEIGSPPQTIAVHHSQEMLVIYPRLKRVERYPLSGEHTGPWSDTLALLQAGFPESRSEFNRQYRILEQTDTGDLVELLLEPRSAASRRMIPRITIAFSAKDFALTATELAFADGSILRNDFKQPQVNQPLDEALFRPKIEPDYKILEPLKK
jgi:outer membrane lipoprotein carrier protein